MRRLHHSRHSKRTVRYVVAIVALLSLGLQSASAQASTQGNKLITRGETAAILLTLKTKVIPSISNEGWFPDVPQGHPYERYVLAAERFGILSANSSMLLRPDDPVTRASFLKMIVCTFGLQRNLPYIYDDVPSYSWFAPYAGIAMHFGFFADPTDSKLFHPNALISFADAQTVLQRLIDTQSIVVVPSALLVGSEQSHYQLHIYQQIASLEQIAPDTEVTQASSSSAPSAALHGSAPLDPQEEKDRLLSLVNAERTKNHLRPLQINAALSTSAEQYAQEMFREHFFSHTSPDGESPRDRLARAGYNSPARTACNCAQRFLIGENLAWGQTTADEVVDDWMHSATHHDVMLNPGFSDTGIGYAGNIWVEQFGGVERLSSP